MTGTGTTWIGLEFQSTPSAWRVTPDPEIARPKRAAFQSTPSAWRVTATKACLEPLPPFQSTPSAWRVTAAGAYPGRRQPISIHTLRVEGDVQGYAVELYADKFQSTPSAWRVTWARTSTWPSGGFQSTPSAWRVTCNIVPKWSSQKFQSTPSAWRVTFCKTYNVHPYIISIHTLRVEGDSKSAQKSRTLLFKVTDLRRNCRPDVHKRTEGSL